MIDFLKNIIPFLIFIALFPMTRSLWLYYKNRTFETSLNWKLFLLKMPVELKRNPRSMDQFLHSISGARNASGHLGEKYFLGEVTVKWTFELIAYQGEVRFYARVTEEYVPIFKSALFAAYPEIEILTVEDYIDELPNSILDAEIAEIDVAGAEIELVNSAGYPLKTYIEYENPLEQHRVDSMAILIEGFQSFKPEEFFGVQINMTPLQLEWGKKYEHIVESLRTPEKNKISSNLLQRSPRQTEVLQAIERNLAKPGFACTIRVIYVAPENTGGLRRVGNVFAAMLSPHAAEDLNDLGINSGTFTKHATVAQTFPYLFVTARKRARKQRMLTLWKNREHAICRRSGKILSMHPFNLWHSKPIELSSESLASFFHPPASTVLTGPSMRRVESRKMGPPAGTA